MSEQHREGTVGWAFESAMQMERDAAALYRRFAAMFASENEVANFWIGLSADEDEHEAMLRAMLEGLPQEQRREPADREVAMNIERGMRRIETIPQDSVADFDQAYSIAQSLESSEVNLVFTFLAAGSAESKADRQAALKHVAQHQKQFSHCSPQLRDAQWRKTVTAESD